MKILSLLFILLLSISANAALKVIDAQSMGASITSTVFDLAQRPGYACHAVYTGSPNGALTLEGSINGTNWETIASSSVSISAAGSTLYNVSDAQYELARVKYTFSSGSGSLTVTCNTKE